MIKPLTSERLSSGAYLLERSACCDVEAGAEVVIYQFVGAELTLTQAKDSRVRIFQFAIEGAVQSQLVINLVESGAEVACFGYAHATKDEVQTQKILVNHLASHTASQQVYRALSAGKVVFSGRSVIQAGVKKVGAHQSSQNVLLTQQAVVDTKPELEIYADDVQCSHGATVGHLDEDAIFYLQSRGLSRDRAVQLLLTAFAAPVVDAIDDASLQAEVKHSILTKLERAYGK